MKHCVKAYADCFNWSDWRDVQGLSLGPAAHFAESLGRVLQDSWDIICLPPWSLYQFPFQTSHKVQTGFVSTTVSLNIERALCTHKLSLVLRSV